MNVLVATREPEDLIGLIGRAVMSLAVARSFLIVSISSTEEDIQNLIDILTSLNRSSHQQKTYYSVIIGNHKKSALFNSWLSFDTNLSSTPTPLFTSSRSRVSYVTWTHLLQELQGFVPGDGELSLRGIANDIHSLLDYIPWDNDEYCLMDTFVLTSKPIDSCPMLYGALWRLKKWLNASLTFISTDTTTCPVLADWSKCLPAAYVDTFKAIPVTGSVIWRGPLLITKSCTDSTDCIKCNGLELSLSESGSVLKDVAGTGFCISSSHHPTHLEVVQLVSLSRFPMMWVSPIQVNLCINSSYHATSSLDVFRKLFNGSHDAGVLLRLCGRNPSNGCGHSHKTTEDWRNHVLEMENPSSPSFHSLLPLNSCGPFLLAASCYYDDDAISCRAWLLRKPESLINVRHMLLQLYTMKLNTAMPLSKLQLLNEDMNSKEKYIPYCRDEYIKDINTLFKSKDDSEPSKWSEISALHTLENIKKKRIKRINTSELTLGGVSAPPPNEPIPQTTDILSCFTESGLPVTSSDLAPVTMEQSGSFHGMMDSGTSSSVSYTKILNSTPTTARKYHGVNYCLSDEDSLKNEKLSKIQQRFIPREYSSNCSNYETPRKNSEQRKRKLSPQPDEGKQSNNEPAIPECNTEVSNDKEIVPEESCSADVREESSSKSKQTKWTKRGMKKHLERLIASSLKAHGINKSHACFHKCYVKMFKICKMFVQDLKPSSVDVDKQMKKIVDRAIQQVVEFELDQIKIL